MCWLQHCQCAPLTGAVTQAYTACKQSCNHPHFCVGLICRCRSIVGLQVHVLPTVQGSVLVFCCNTPCVCLLQLCSSTDHHTGLSLRPLRCGGLAGIVVTTVGEVCPLHIVCGPGLGLACRCTSSCQHCVHWEKHWCCAWHASAVSVLLQSSCQLLVVYGNVWLP